MFLCISNGYAAKVQTNKWIYDTDTSTDTKSVFALAIGEGDLVYTCSKSGNEFFIYQENDKHYSGKQVVSINSITINNTVGEVVNFDKSFTFESFLGFLDDNSPGNFQVVLSDKTVEAFVVNASAFTKENATVCLNGALNQ
jgi:hypothetical protein